MKTLGWWATGFTFSAMLVALFVGFLAQRATAGDTGYLTGQPAPEAQRPQVHQYTGVVALAIAAVVGASCLGAGYAVGLVGSAAMGAASENPELIGRSLIFVGLAEGIAIYGLIVAILLLRYITV